MCSFSFLPFWSRLLKEVPEELVVGSAMIADSSDELERKLIEAQTALSLRGILASATLPLRTAGSAGVNVPAQTAFEHPVRHCSPPTFRTDTLPHPRTTDRPPSPTSCCRSCGRRALSKPRTTNPPHSSLQCNEGRFFRIADTSRVAR
jgi:hypothetical protein